MTLLAVIAYEQNSAKPVRSPVADDNTAQIYSPEKSKPIAAARWHDGQISSLFALGEFHSNHAGPATNEKRGTRSAAFEFSLLASLREASFQQIRTRYASGARVARS